MFILAFTCSYRYSYSHSDMYMYIYIHRHIHIYIHTHVSTCTYICVHALCGGSIVGVAWRVVLGGAGICVRALNLNLTVLTWWCLE